MDVEKKRSKGGFLNFFDWHGKKSRKKLFSNEAELLEYPKQRNHNVGSIKQPELHNMLEADESRTSSGNKQSSEFNCASSVASEDGHGARAPSVVARLMGLDSLPIQCTSDNRLPVALDPYSLSTRSHNVRNANNLWSGGEPVEYINLPWNRVETRFTTAQSRPIEKFQTEILPPKSAKSIPVTHNRLLSPIRSPGFVPTKNAAHIIEAASRIIEPSPRAVSKVRVSTVGSSPVPLKIRDLKEKLESAHKASKPQTPNDSSSHAKIAREKQREKRNIASLSLGKSVADGSRNKARVASTLILPQARTTAQKREKSGLGSNNRAPVSQKEKNSATKPRVHKIQSDASKAVNKGTSANAAGKTVLQQNNRKQNCKDTLGPKGVNGVVNKVVVDSEASCASRKTGPGLSRRDKVMSLSRRKTLSRDRKAVDGDIQESVSGYKRNGIRNPRLDANVKYDTNKRSKDMDVISFTFSSPIKGLSSESQMTARGTEKDAGSYTNSLTFTSRFNLIDSDDLNTILEQKIRELTNKIESSAHNTIQEEALKSFAGLRQDIQFQQSLNGEASQSLYEPDQTSFDDRGHVLKRKYQIVEYKDAEYNGVKQPENLHASPVSDLDSFSSGGCLDYTSNTNGTKRCFYTEDQKSVSWDSTNDSQPTQDETEMSESASSISMGTYGFIDSKETSNCELEYIRCILNNCEILLKEFTLGQTEKIIPPSLFDQLENHASRTEFNEEEDPKVTRKALFDCVSECLELRSQQLVTGGFKALGKHTALFWKKELLAQDLYKEIVSWENMAELMVDELVDKDMSSGNGRWLDYDREAFEEGTEIEKWVVTCLVDEVVSDLLRF